MGYQQQQINYGASVNDGQGDPLRTAFIKTDDNFDNIWLAGPVGSNITITNNTIAATNTNGDLVLSTNGTGNIRITRHVIPYGNRAYDIGSSDNYLRSLYANTITAVQSDLGNLANIRIEGGANGYVLSTDGAGNLTWVAQSGGGGSANSIANGDSHVRINVPNGNVDVSANANDWRFGDDGLLTLPGGYTKIGGQYGSEAILASNVNFGVATQGANVTTFMNWSDDVANTSILSAIYVNAPNANTGDIVLRTGAIGDARVWNFGTDGNMTLPNQGNIIGTTVANSGRLQWLGNSSGDGSGYTTLHLIPDDTLIAGDQYLIIDPTAGGHVHIRAGGTQDDSYGYLYLGGEHSYFMVPAGSNPSLYVAANNNVWTFYSDGVFDAPGNITTTGAVIAGNVVTNFLRSDDSAMMVVQDGLIVDGGLEVWGSTTAQTTVTTPVALSTLTAVAGARAFINDGNLVAAGNFGTQVGGGGSNTVPVWSDGTSWYIG